MIIVTEFRFRLAALAMVFAANLFAQPIKITDDEEHLLRGFFERQSHFVNYHKLALEKGSSQAIRDFAQAELNMLAEMEVGIRAIMRQAGVANRPIEPGNNSPALGEGLSRGYQSLPENYSWTTTNLSQMIEQPLEIPQTVDNSNEARRGVNELPELAKLSGQAFDRAYLLRTIQSHSHIINYCMDTVANPEANAELVAFARQYGPVITRASETADGLFRGQQPRNR